VSCFITMIYRLRLKQLLDKSCLSKRGRGVCPALKK
jgi:hypothetical protein